MSASPPLLRVVTPDATPEEVAALVVALASVTRSAAPPRPPGRGWAARHRSLRRTLRPGRGGWRASGLPG